MKTQVVTVPWLGETAILPYAWLPLTDGGYRYATLIQAPVPWVMLRQRLGQAGTLPADLRPYASRLRLGYSYPLDPAEHYDVKPCAFTPTGPSGTQDADALFVPNGTANGDMAGVTAGQATALGGATAPTVSWRERRCIIVLSDEPLDEPGDLYLDVQLGAGAVGTTNYLLSQTVHGMRSLMVDCWNLGAFVQSAFILGLERTSLVGDLQDVALAFSAIPSPGYMKSWMVADSAGLPAQAAAAAYATMPGILLYGINSSLGTAANRFIVRGRMRA